jgi:hypothetical protein
MKKNEYRIQKSEFRKECGSQNQKSEWGAEENRDKREKSIQNSESGF